MAAEDGASAEKFKIDWEADAVPTDPLLPVTDGERELLTGLSSAMEEKDLDQAARILNDNEEQFKILADKTLEGENYLFYVERTAQGDELCRMTAMTPETSGYGLVLTRFNTAFYGSFKNGSPNGVCSAVQTVILDFPRYSFAEGMWKDGKMNGKGVTGHRYYDGKPEGSFEAVTKTGPYVDNLLNGEMVYEADNGSGRVLHWNILAEMGVTVLDDRWDYYDYSDEYMLRSQEDEDRAYVISGVTKEAVRWNNLILWEE